MRLRPSGVKCTPKLTLHPAYPNGCIRIQLRFVFRTDAAVDAIVSTATFLPMGSVTVRRYLNSLAETGILTAARSCETGGRPCMLHKIASKGESKEPPLRAKRNAGAVLYIGNFSDAVWAQDHSHWPSISCIHAYTSIS